MTSRFEPARQPRRPDPMSMPIVKPPSIIRHHTEVTGPCSTAILIAATLDPAQPGLRRSRDPHDPGLMAAPRATVGELQVGKSDWR
jgi:hypothetical protein